MTFVHDSQLTLAVCFVFDDLFTKWWRRENLKNYTHIYSSFQSTQYSRVIATYAVLVFELVFWIVNRIKLTRKSDKVKTFFFDWFFYDNEKYLQHKNREKPQFWEKCKNGTEIDLFQIFKNIAIKRKSRATENRFKFLFYNCESDSHIVKIPKSHKIIRKVLTIFEV